MQTKDELRLGSDQQVEVVGMVLAEGEGLKAIQDQGLAEAEVPQSLGVESQGLAAESQVPVGQQSGGDSQGTAGLAES